jgi:hypothetical protein
MSLPPVPRLAPRALALAALFALAPAAAKAEYVIDLTKNNTTSGTDGVAQFVRTDQQPTGTGYIDPFVRIQMTGTEKGYNTDGTAQFNTKDAGGTNWDHSVLVSDLQAVTLADGKQYYQFLLDVNEQGSPSGQLLSMNDLQIWLGKTGNLDNWNTTTGGFGASSVMAYQMDNNGLGDETVNLNYKFASGSGSGDLFVYIPKALIDANAGQYPYLYLYSAFGNPYSSDAGFEEWATFTKTDKTTTNNPVPAPPSAVLAGLALGGLAFRRVFRRKTAAAV